MAESISFSSAELESSLSTLSKRGVTELVVHDREITGHKGRLLHFLQQAAEKAPEVFYTLPLEAGLLDMDVAKAASALYCSIELPLYGSSKGTAYLFDKKLYARRADMLNTLGLVFGFSLRYAAEKGDALKLFQDRLNFAISLYPNHVDFPQLEGEEPAKPTATFSTQDIAHARQAAFACSVFYSAGRAVPWFLAVLAPLKMSASRFFQDFAEWQQLNNCGPESGWQAEKARHEDIEKMQLAFLRFKYEEKGKEPLFAAVTDIVRLNGAMARCAGEGEESRLVLQYNPDDLLSPVALDIARFSDSVCMEDMRIRVYYDEERGVDWKAEP